ncbi:hypothetical protein RFI_23438 [Reticulomyxa filosa]|uniref:Uncharacterized protein n=1 Tax=Reticulomyxa filosa TaxID=46433 RepID=X6MJB5_RETFI|nr:hypothetical protein RFI_23438 [Reticulomyxa filosa]|eukprot:ETO13929.1 hypothetical protein RFI_23438 [Reticulomyxa filosa]
MSQATEEKQDGAKSFRNLTKQEARQLLLLRKRERKSDLKPVTEHKESAQSSAALTKYIRSREWTEKYVNETMILIDGLTQKQRYEHNQKLERMQEMEKNQAAGKEIVMFQTNKQWGKKHVEIIICLTSIKTLKIPKQNTIHRPRLPWEFGVKHLT